MWRWMLLVMAVAWGALASPYLWSFDLFSVGNWAYVLFANTTDKTLDGLSLRLTEVPQKIQGLVIGGGFLKLEVDGTSVRAEATIDVNGVVVLAWSPGPRVSWAGWTQGGELVEEIDVESPIPRVDVVDLIPLLVAEAPPPEESENPPLFLPINRRPPFDDWDRYWDRYWLKPPLALPPIRVWPVGKPIYILPYFPWPIHPGLPPTEEMPVWAESDFFKHPFLLSAFRSESPVGSRIVKYAWSFENEVVLEGPVVICDFRDPGPHRVLLTVWDEVGRSRSLPIVVEVPELEPISEEPPQEPFPGE